MLKIRVIPCLLLQSSGLIKTIKFKNAKYVGDPINAVRIFNDKEVDELVIIDIDASKKNKEPEFELLTRIAKEAFMPMAYGGGIKNIAQIQQLFWLGYEKVIINNATLPNYNLIESASRLCGGQSIVAAIDIKRDWKGKPCVYDHVTGKLLRMSPIDHLKNIEAAGAGEIIVNSVDRDGTMSGYEVELMRTYAATLKVPVIALGGAGSLEHFSDVVRKGHVAAVSAGSMFVFHGPHRAVLITYPEKESLINAFK